MLSIQKFEHLVVDAVEVVEFKLVRKEQDLESDELTFKPTMAHQIFGQQETIFGYEGLKIRMYYSAGPLNIYLGVEYKAKVDELSGGEIKADDVVSAITDTLPDGCYFVNMDEFLKTIQRANKFNPYGEKLSESIIKSKDGRERVFEFYHCDCSKKAFLKFFSRLQTFILWFVDAASYIDVDDPRWSFFICYEKYKNENGDTAYVAVGYTTVYEYYAYPEHMRPRVSQMLVLPPFQKLGLGTQALEAVYKFYHGMKKVIDITVEDPSEDFTRMRNFVDSRLCLPLKSFRAEIIKNGFTKEMAEEARSEYKLNPLQTRKIYEILRLYHTNVHNEEEYRAYRLDVKHRLSIVHHKQLEDLKRLEKRNMDTEWLRARLPAKDQHMDQLDAEYKQLETEYSRVVDKLRLD